MFVLGIYLNLRNCKQLFGPEINLKNNDIFWIFFFPITFIRKWKKKNAENYLNIILLLRLIFGRGEGNVRRHHSDGTKKKKKQSRRVNTINITVITEPIKTIIKI